MEGKLLKLKDCFAGSDIVSAVLRNPHDSLRSHKDDHLIIYRTLVHSVDITHIFRRVKVEIYGFEVKLIRNFYPSVSSGCAAVNGAFICQNEHICVIFLAVAAPDDIV